MRAIGFPSEPSEFDFPEEMAELKRRLKDADTKVNVSDKTLEILWYKFSSDYSDFSGYWIEVDDETFADFCEWLSRYKLS